MDMAHGHGQAGCRLPFKETDERGAHCATGRESYQKAAYLLQKQDVAMKPLISTRLLLIWRKCFAGFTRNIAFAVELTSRKMMVMADVGR